MALNYLNGELKGPVRKPTGHEPLATHVDKLLSGALNYHGMPIVADTRPTLAGAAGAPRAMLTKPVAHAPAFYSDIPLPFHTVVYNANARHVPDIESIGADAAARAQQMRDLAIRESYVPTSGPIGAIHEGAIAALQNQILEKKLQLARSGMTQEQIEAATEPDMRQLRAAMIQRDEAMSGMTPTRLRVESMMGAALPSDVAERQNTALTAHLSNLVGDAVGKQIAGLRAANVMPQAQLDSRPATDASMELSRAHSIKSGKTTGVTEITPDQNAVSASLAHPKTSNILGRRAGVSRVVEDVMRKFRQRRRMTTAQISQVRLQPGAPISLKGPPDTTRGQRAFTSKRVMEMGGGAKIFGPAKAAVKQLAFDEIDAVGRGARSAVKAPLGTGRGDDMILEDVEPVDDLPPRETVHMNIFKAPAPMSPVQIVAEARQHLAAVAAQKQLVYGPAQTIGGGITVQTVSPQMQTRGMRARTGNVLLNPLAGLGGAGAGIGKPAASKKPR